MLTLAQAVSELQAGREVEVCPRGNSMYPKIVSGSRVSLEPLHETPKRGDVVLTKVRGHLYLHLVSAVEGKRVQISNNHGHINGWTTVDRVYGRVKTITS